MKLNLNPLASRLLPERWHVRAMPFIDKAESVFNSDDDSAVSRRTALFAFTIRIFSAAIAYISQVILARWMGDFEYGIFVAVWVAAVVLGGIACLGFQTGIIRFISQYRASKEPDLLRGAIFSSVTTALIASMCIAIVGAYGVHWLDDWFSHYFIWPIYLAAICLPMLSVSEVLDGIARAYNWPSIALIPTFILRPILILLSMMTAVWLGYPANAETAMIATILATLASSTGQYLFLYQKLKTVVPKGNREFKQVHWLTITMPIFLIEGFYNLLTNVDILFVSHYLQPEKVAVYFAAAKTLALVHFVYFAVKAAAAHRFTTYHASGDHTRYEQFIQETVRWTFWPSLGLALLMMAIGKYFLMLFGETFVAGESIIWILTIGIVARSSVGPAESVLTMSGQQKACAAVYAATLFLNLFLNWQLIPIYGLNGAAMATSGAMVFEAFALYSAAQRYLGLHIFIVPGKHTRRTSNSAAE